MLAACEKKKEAAPTSPTGTAAGSAEGSAVVPVTPPTGTGTAVVPPAGDTPVTPGSGEPAVTPPADNGPKLLGKAFGSEVALPKSAKGTLVEGQSFTDSAGENFVFLTSKGTTARTLMAVQVIRDAAGADKVVREIRDFSDCVVAGSTSATSFVADTLRVTDLNADGVNEVSFVYQVGCDYDGDVQATTKAVLLQGGTKYIRRLAAPVGGDNYGDGGFGGDEYGNASRAKVEPAEAKWPTGFLAFLNERAGF